MKQVSYEELLNTYSKELISNEGEIILNLYLSVRNSAIALSIIPFCALYCKSAKEFFNIKSTNNDVENDVRDLRNGLKIFVDKYSKGLRMTMKSDYQQDEEFKSRLKFKILGKFNFHLNLGVYFTEFGRVIFNTQLSNFYLNIPNGKSAMEIGNELGSEIGQILIEQCGINDFKQYMVFNSVPKYGYIDFNTNRKNAFFNIDFDKETNLMLLHMLSMIGGINNLIIPVFQNKNTWLLRIMYVTVHNTWMGIKKISNHFAQNKTIRLKNLDIKKEEINLLSTTFRNCMMHYSLINKNGISSISPKYFDDKVPLYGLVESCYSGMHYEEFFDNLFNLSKKIELYLLSFFNVDENKIRWGLD